MTLKASTFNVSILCEVYASGERHQKHLDFEVEAQSATEAALRTSHALRVLIDEYGEGTVGDPRPETNSCGYQCFIIGGPFIAEDPACPTHVTLQQKRKRKKR